MFEFVKESNLALDELAKKDKNYKSILTQLKSLLSEIKGEFLTFDKAHKKAEQSTNESHQEIKMRFNEKIKTLELNLHDFSNQIDLQVSQLEMNYKEEYQSILNNTKTEVERIKSLILNIEYAFNESKSKAHSIRSKEISDISKVMVDIKKQSAQSITLLESNYKKEFEKIIENFESNQALLLLEIEDATKNYEKEKSKISHIKNFYREQSDKKYLSIKNDYHAASIEFNKSLETLKKEKEHHLKELKQSDEANRLPIEDALDKLKLDYEAQKLQVEQTYKEKLEAHKNKIEVITTNFNTKKDELTIAYSDALSLVNSKLSSFRDVIANDRLDRNQKLKEDLKETQNEDAIKALKKDVKRHLRQQDAELNRQIIRTEKESHALLKAHYQKLQDLELKYLEDKSNWRVTGKKLIIDQKLENYMNEQNYQYQLKSLQLQLKTLKSTYEFELEKTDITHLSQIAPLDLKLSVANAISEKDVNLLSNDTNYHLNFYQHQEDSLTHNFTVFKLTKEHELEVLYLTKEHDLSVSNMSLQLSIDKENVIREQQLANQQLKKDYIEYTYQKQVSSEELIYLKQKALYENEIQHLMKSEHSYHNYLTDKRVIEQSILKHKRSIEETNIHFLERLESVDMTNEMLTKDLEVIHSRIHYLFNQIYLIYNIHHHFMLSLIQIYEIPAHPEDVKQYIHLYLEVFKHLNSIQEQAKDQFLLDLNTFQEVKINDLSALKLKTNNDLLESEYMAKIKTIDLDITSTNQIISDIEDRILVLSSNVDRVQFELNEIETSDNPKASLSTKKDLTKQLNIIESEISTLDKSIIKYNNQIDLLNKRKNRLLGELDKKRSITLSKNQTDTKSYLKQKLFYIHGIKQITQLFKVYEEKVLVITNKLDQPLYLTDNIIKEYQKGYTRIEEYFEKTSNAIYQSLLKGSVSLYDKLMAQQNISKKDFLTEQKHLLKKLDKQQLEFELKLKNLSSDFKHHLQLLSDEKDTIIQNINTVQFKSQEQDLINQQKLMSLTESKIMSTESNLNKEILLIDDNLKSVILQMHSDFDKQIQKIKLQHDKNILKHNEAMLLKTKNLKALEESTKLKNGQLSIRFTQAEVKLIELNKEKIANYEQSIQKKHSLLLKKIQSYADELKSAQTKKDLSIKDNESKLIAFTSKVETHERKILQKDLKDAKASYQFKQRTLKL
ncbi:hypothetical protein [Acholeplasma laidlawii]|uniref:hypothetical protein n=1 Tax=Acholeplasma laidlawii TaxID=2148 RepID=UPI0021F783A9|nr:hypothetical protein [Acholeplasma laidlawii]